jgi:sugar/nucleoside kinase (ribokinase family)
MASVSGPSLIIVGQITIDDVVPARPGPWQRQIGGSSLYALAGARLWLDIDRIGLLARLGGDYPFDVEALLQQVGMRHLALRRFPGEHLIEWLIYEPDGSRRSLPRNTALLDTGAEGGSVHLPYREQLLQIAPSADELPSDWLPARALHLCPQVGTRHRDSLQAWSGQIEWISVDPSPHYSRTMSVERLAQHLQGANAFMPSEQEIRPLLLRSTPEKLALELNRMGLDEVIIKRAEQPVLVCNDSAVIAVPVQPVGVVDPTGAGDAFCGAYAACRVLGLSPIDSARRAAATAALVVQCRGVEVALTLSRPDSWDNG